MVSLLFQTVSICCYGNAESVKIGRTDLRDLEVNRCPIRGNCSALALLCVVWFMLSCCNDGPLPIPGEDYPRDELTGLFVDNYATGEKKEESLYLDGWKNGVSTYWYPNGTKRSEGSFEKGKKTGIWYYWYEEGAVEGIVPYENGDAHGKMESRWPNGHLKRIGYMNHGNADGVWRFWYDNGNLETEGRYILSHRMGEWKYYHPDGSVDESRTRVFSE